MSPFWHFARQLLHFRGTLIAAMLFATLAGGSLGVGLLGLLPVLRIVLAEEDAKSLPQIAHESNVERIAKAAEKERPEPLFLIPQPIIDALPDDPFRGVALLIVLLLLLTAFGALCNFLHQYFSMTVVTRTVAAIREQTFRRVVEMPLVAVFQRGPSQLVARIIRDTVELRSGLGVLTSKFVAQLAKGVGAFVIALVLHPGLTLLAVIVVPGLAVLMRKIGKRIRRGTKRALEGQADLLHIASEALQGLRAVKANTAEARTADRFAKTNQRVVKQELRVRTAKAATSPLMETISVLVIGALALFAVHMIVQGTLAVDRFFVTLAALAVAGASFRPMASFYNEIQAASAPAGRLMELLNEDLEEDAKRRSSLPDLPRHRRSLEFESVTFTYPGAERPAIEDITLRILHGERIAIVGPNGSGKTTLLGFVPRLLRPTSGAVLIDGIDIATVDLKSLRKQIGVVTQETVMFRGTIAENIAYGVDPENATMERIISAAKRAHADEFIQQIPGGYDASVLEYGSSLSGGQRQRIAIARAIMREPAILILDEATSQIDAESEDHINAALKEFCKGRTALVIAHRLSTVLNADRIVVMDQGRIVDQGTHAQLLARCDLYARLNHTQLAGA